MVRKRHVTVAACRWNVPAWYVTFCCNVSSVAPASIWRCIILVLHRRNGTRLAYIDNQNNHATDRSMSTTHVYVCVCVDGVIPARGDRYHYTIFSNYSNYCARKRNPEQKLVVGQRRRKQKSIGYPSGKEDKQTQSHTHTLRHTQTASSPTKAPRRFSK